MVLLKASHCYPTHSSHSPPPLSVQEAMWSPDEVLLNIEEDSIRDRIAHSPERYTRDGTGLHRLRSGAAVSVPSSAERGALDPSPDPTTQRWYQ